MYKANSFIDSTWTCEREAGAVPAGMRHYGWTDSGTVVQIHGNGSFAITYVNPEDDPSKGTTKASD